MGETYDFEYRQDYFSRNNTDCIKGFFAILVVLSHIWGQIAKDINTGGFIIHNLGRLFTIMGYTSVSMFLFLSGYGLMSQYEKKGKDYIKSFPKRNILSLYAINVLLIIIYCAFNTLMGSQFDLPQFIASFLFGNTVIPYGWYLQAIILFYIMFYISCLLAKSTEKRLMLISLFLIIYNIAASKFLTSTWYECSFAFVFGMFFRFKKDLIDLAIKEKYGIFLVFVILLFLPSCFFGSRTLFGVGIYLKMLSTLLFCFMMVLLAMKITFKNPVTTFLSKIYLEIYVLQGMAIAFFRSDIIYIENAYLYGATVIIATLLFAFVFHPVFEKIIRFFK